MQIEMKSQSVDRLVFAAGLTRGKRVLDIGGRPMPAPPKDVRVETWLAAEIANTQAFDRVKLNLAEIPHAADLIVQHLRKPYGE